MKIIITTFFVLLLFTVQGQKKKDITSEVKKYRYDAIMNATYDGEMEILEKNIENYLSKFGYKKSTNPDDGMLFRVSHGGGYKISEYPPKGQAPTKEKGKKTGVEEPVLKTKKQKYKSVYYTTIRELVLDVDGEKKLRVNLNENSFPNPGEDNKIHRGYFTINRMYYELKKHLYVQYHNGIVELPEELVARVNTFNETKKSNRRKIDLKNL